ncbi:4'-phosphopantetheinyl transferase family protein, partial [Streptomyces sp. NPDC002519]
MIEELLPGSVAVVEAHGRDALGDGVLLYPEEEAVVTRAVEKRRREFRAARGCARQAMEKLGVPPAPILPGERGAPRWPDGLIGSMTHCEGYCAAALVHVGELVSVGIDAEPHERLPEGVLEVVALPTEQTWLRGAGYNFVRWFAAAAAPFLAPKIEEWSDIH